MPQALNESSSRSSNELPSSSRRSVAWIIHGDEQYGMRRAILSLATAVRDLGWQVLIVSLRNGACATECREHGLEIVFLDIDRAPSLHLHSSFFRRVWALVEIKLQQRHVEARLNRALYKRHFDVLHTLNVNTIQAVGRFARTRGIPSFWEMTSAVSDRYPFGINRLAYQLMCYRFRIIPLANSQYTASTIGSRFVKPVVMKLGVDAKLFDPAKATAITRGQLGLPDDAVVFAQVSRVESEKGQELTVRALGQLRAEFPKLHLVFLGDGDEPQFPIHLKALTRELGIAERVHFKGEVRNPEANYPLFDVAINSRITPEPFGLSVIEAMAMERPVIVTALGGPAETVLDNITGWHVPAATVECFVAAFRRAMGDQARWLEMGREGRRRVLQHFTTEQQVAQYCGIVESLCTRDKPAQ